jgi:hypothetical protein
MSILDQQRNQKGVQALGTEFVGTTVAGHGCMIAHTNGNVYCVFARNYLDAVQERRLYISYSSDNGITWAAPTELTSGNWDDEPAGIQLDPTDTASEIGVVFLRTNSVTGTTQVPTLTRIGINASTLALTTPVDPITGSPTGYRSPALVQTSTGFLIFACNVNPAAAMFVWSNTAFATNTWSSSNIGTFFGSATTLIFSVNAKRLANGHIGIVSAVRTALAGSDAIPGTGNQDTHIVRTDVFTAFSADDGGTWGSVQNLTNYAGTPLQDMIGQPIAFDADLAELSDGSVVVAFNEGFAPQVVATTLTTLGLGASAGSVTAVVYHPGKNYLIIGCADATNGGVFILDLTGQTVTRLHTSSTPAIWANTVASIDLSSDGKYLAVGHGSGLEIIDTTDALIANWTIVPIRTTTSPASLTNAVAYCRFDTSGYTLYVAYGAASSANVWGFLIDASNPVALTNLMSTTGGTIANNYFVITSGGLISVPGGTSRISKTNKSTGADTYTTTITGAAFNAIFHDDVNDEYVAFGTNASAANGIHRISDSGAAFSITESFTATTNPAAKGPANVLKQHGVIPGSGILYTQAADTGSSTVRGFYSFIAQKPLGYVQSYQTADLGDTYMTLAPALIRPIKTDAWMFSGLNNTAAALFIDLQHSGRVRYGFFPYVAGTQQLTTAGVDFYDMVNLTRVGTGAGNTLQKLSIDANATDDLFLYARKADYTGIANPLAAVNGHVEPDAYKLTMRGRVLKTITSTLDVRARIRNTYSATLDMRSRIVFAQCIYMKARIVPINTVTMTMGARIQGAKSSDLIVSYDVQALQSGQIRVQFSALTGYIARQGVSLQARIVPIKRSRMTGYFLVQAGAVSGGITFISTLKGMPTVAMRAFIQR